MILPALVSDGYRRAGDWIVNGIFDWSDLRVQVWRLGAVSYISKGAIPGSI
jgi:hypothetical protein